MNRTYYLIIVIAALGAAYLLVPGNETEQTQAQTLEEGIRLAREQDKLIFLYINSDNCSYCRLLERQFTESEEFQEIIDQHFVWVTLKFEENLTLANRFGLRGPPALIVMDQNGEGIIGIPGYPPRGVLDVIAMLEEALK
jgi:thioredoxin-related protein